MQDQSVLEENKVINLSAFSLSAGKLGNVGSWSKALEDWEN